MKLNPLQELNFLQWAASEGVQPTDAMRQQWLNPRGFKGGGEVGGGGDIQYPHPLDPNALPAKGSLDFLGEDTLEKMVQNILVVYDSTTGENAWLREAGKTWYPAARAWVEKILQFGDADMDLDKAVSILAQFSENKKWPENMRIFLQYLAGEKPGTFGDTIDVAKRIDGSDDPLMAGRGQKIYNFLRSILGGDRFPDAVAVDRWADRIALGVADNPELWSLADDLRKRGKYPGPLPGGGTFTRAYDLMQQAYQIAAERRGVLPSEMQGVTWVRGGATDETIRSFQELGEWRFPVTPDAIADLAWEQLQSGESGFTIDVSGESAQHGMAYAPSKATEEPFDPKTLTKEKLRAYVRDHWKQLRKPGMHFGGGIEEGRGFLDISKVEVSGPDVIAKAQKAKQEGVFDFDAPKDHQWVPVGEEDDAGEYRKLGTPTEILKAHQDDVEKFSGPKQAPAKPEPPKPVEPPPVQESKPLPKNLKPLREKPLPEGWGSGPGSARAIPRMGLGEIAGKVLGPGMFGTSEDQLVVGKDGKLYHGDGQPYEGARGESQKELEQLATLPFMGESSGQEPHVDTTKQPIEAHDAQGNPIPVGGDPLGPKRSAPAAPSSPPLKPSTLPVPPPGPNVKSWWGLKIDTQIMIRHANGSPPTPYKLRQTGPNQYESPNAIPLAPGDEIIINGRRVR